MTIHFNSFRKLFRIVGISLFANLLLISAQELVKGADLINRNSKQTNLILEKPNQCKITQTNQTSTERSLRAKSYFDQGLLEFKQENYEQAIGCFTQALELNPNYSEALFQRGLAYTKLENHRDAFYDFDAFLELKPNDAEALFNRGIAQFYRGTAYYGEAIEDFTQVIQLKPNYAEAYLYRAEASSTDPRYTDYDRAIADINQFLQLQQSHSEAKQDIAWAYGLRGSAYLNKDNYNQAISDLTQSLQLNPEPSIFYLKRGSAYYGNGNYQQAISDYTKVLQLRPDFSLAFSSRADAYLAVGNYDQAIEDYTNEIKAMGFDYPQLYYDRGYAYVLKGDKQSAIRDFEKVIELTKKTDFSSDNTDSELREKAKKQLQKLRPGVV